VYITSVYDLMPSPLVKQPWSRHESDPSFVCRC